MTTAAVHRDTHSQEVAFVLLDLVADVLVEEQLAEDEGAHGLHIQTLCLRQDLFISCVDGSILLLVLQMETSKVTEGTIHKSRFKCSICVVFPHRSFLFF